MCQYEFHPIANAFPLMEGKEFDELCADVKAHGVHHEIILYENQILDGRNRYRAAKKAGCKPDFRRFDKEIDGDDPIAFVVSCNLRRRHLDESNRAMAAARLAGLRTAGNPTINGKSPIPSIDGIGQQAAAAALNVSVKSVERATKVIKEASPEVVAAVQSGTVSVSDAAAVASKPKAEQRAAVKAVREGKAKTLKAATKSEPHQRNGKPTKNTQAWALWEAAFGKLKRGTDELNDAYPAHKFHRDVTAKLNECFDLFKEWRKATR